MGIRTKEFEKIGRASVKAASRIRFDSRAARLIGEEITEAARDRAPVGKTRTIRDSGDFKINKSARTVTISFRAMRGHFNYAYAQEYGTRHHGGRLYLTRGAAYRMKRCLDILGDRGLTIISREWGAK